MRRFLITLVNDKHAEIVKSTIASSSNMAEIMAMNKYGANWVVISIREV